MSAQDRVDAALAAALAANRDGLGIRPGGPIPLTPSQSGFYFAWKLDSEGASGNRPVGIELAGPLDTAALKNAIVGVIDRHEPLRCVYTEIDGTPVQVAAERAGRMDIETIDVSTAPDPLVDAKTHALGLIDRRFKLADELPIRAELYRLGTDHHLLVLVIHHVAFDGWSEQILISDLESLYAGAPPSDEPASFGAYATWTDRRANATETERDLAFWRKKLKDLTPGFAYQGEPDPSEVVFGPVATVLDPALADSVRTTALEHDTTPFVVLLTALDILLARYSGDPDQAIAVVSAGRDHPEVENTVGCFVKTVPVRVNASEEATASELIRSVRSEVLTGLSHTAAPYGRLVSEMRPRTAATDAYPLAVLFQMRNFPLHRSSAPRQVRFESIRLHQAPGDFDLSVRATETDRTFTIDFEYEAHRFSRSDIEQIVDSYVRVLQAIASDQSMTVGAISLISPDRRHQELHEFNFDPWGHDDPLPIRVIEQQVAREPDAIAHIEGGVSTTYAELNSLANRIAHDLIGFGGGRGDIVVLYLRNSRAFVLSVLATMKAGAVFANVDATDTRKWVGDIVDDTDPVAIITTSDLVGDVAGMGVPVITADEAQGDATLPNPDVEIRADDRGYIQFTSGSTGRPKGVLHPQRSLAAFAANGMGFDFKAGDRVAQMHVTGFDPALRASVMPLMVGGTLVARDEAARGTIDRFFEWCDDLGITHLLVPRSFFHTMEERATSAGLPLPRKLRVVSSSGEQIRSDSAQRWHDTYGREMAHLNLYGATEGIVSTVKNVEVYDQMPDLIPVGRGTLRSTAYVLERNGEPAPIGVVGEIVIGGSYIAIGYLNRPEETADRFRIDPFSDHPDATVYHTGDLGRRLSSGDIEFLGRGDRQVKVRGVRVEPTGIEHNIRQIAGISDCVVVPFAAPDGTTRLAAYVQPDSGATVDGDTIRVTLLDKQPEFSVPTVIVMVDALPRLSSGKVAHSDLPDLPKAGAGIVATENSAADKHDRARIEDVMRIWGDVLGRGMPGPDDDFFDFGGYSLAAAKVLARVKDRYGIDLPLAALYDNSTPRRFAAQIPAWLTEDRPDHIIVLSEGADRPPLWCMHIVSGEVYSYEPMARLLDPGQPVLGVVPATASGRDDTPRTVPNMAARYADAIEAAMPIGPCRIIGYSWASRLALEVAAILEDRGRTVDFLGIIDSWHPTQDQDGGATRMKIRARAVEPGPRILRSVKRWGRIPRRVRYHIAIAWHGLQRSALPHWVAVRRQTRIGVRAMSSNQPRTPKCRVTYFRAVGQDGTPTDNRFDRWAAEGDADVIDIIGDHRGHHAIVADPQASALADAVSEHLAQRGLP